MCILGVCLVREDVAYQDMRGLPRNTVPHDYYDTYTVVLP